MTIFDLIALLITILILVILLFFGIIWKLLVPSTVPVILNWNIGSTVSDQVCENSLVERQINTFKCLVNGDISLSWNTNNVLKLD